MLQMLKRPVLLGVSIGALLSGSIAAAEQPALKPLLKTRVDPKEFGVQDERITVIHASSFAVDYIEQSYFSPYLGRYPNYPLNSDFHYYATLDLPAGEVLDIIELNTANDTDSVFGS